MVEFYRSANHSQDTATGESKYAEEVYLPMEGGTVDDEWCANVAYDEDTYTDSMIGKDYSEAIYTELFEGMYRYPGDANGALRRPGEIFSRGFEYYEAEVPGGYYEDGSDVYTREWYVYAPESAQTKIDAGEKVPLVFVFHGAGGTGNEIADRSGWAKVADENGFIIVMPTGSIKITPREINNKVFPDMRPAWNTGAATETRPSDLDLVRYIYNWMTTDYKYADSIDTTRVYASGQSSGGMMSWACAAELPDIFTAAAPVSATRALEPDESAGIMIPIIAFIGEEDATFAGGFGSEDGKDAIDYWTERNNTVQGWDDYTYMEDDSKAPAPEGPGDKDLFTNYIFENADGVPMLRCVEVATKTHAIWPSECFTAWDEWFTHFTKEDGVLYYDGEAVANVATRGQLVNELYELEGSPATTASSQFADVTDTLYCYDAVVWASETGVVNGVSETEYDPHVSITREQLAAMIYRYAEYKGYDVSATTSLDSYDDAGDVSDYAAEALAWAVAEGLVEGVDDNTLQPQGTASSEQIATILERFVANIA